MRLYTVLFYFLQTVLHVLDNTFIHHQYHIQTVITKSGTGARCCNYSLHVILMMDEVIIRNM